MKHCIHCGDAIKDDAHFCIHCGEPVETTIETKSTALSKNEMKSATSAPQQTLNQQQQYKVKNPFFKSKTSKMWTILIVSVAILFLGTYFVINKYIYNPEKVANNFIVAVNEKDVPAIQSLMKENKMKSDVSKEEIENFLEYLDDQPKMLSNISSHLKEEAIHLGKKNTELAEGFGYTDEESLATIKRDGKKWLLFDNYFVSLLPMYLEVHLPENMEEKVDLFVNNQKEETKKKDVFNIGPLLPGNHHVKAVTKGEFGEVEQEQQVDFSEEGTEALVDIDFYNNYITVYSDNYDAKVFVNGNDTKQKIEDFEYTGLGPLPKDGSVEVYAEKKFSSGKKKSDVVKIDEDIEEVDLYFDYDDYDEVYDIHDVSGEDEEDEIEDIIISHYEGISNQDYSSAYSYFSESKKDEYSLDAWEDGLEDTIEDTVDYVEVDSFSDEKAKVSLEMTSYEQDGDDISVAEWEGYWELILENGEWKLDKAKLDKVDSWTE